MNSEGADRSPQGAPQGALPEPVPEPEPVPMATEEVVTVGPEEASEAAVDAVYAARPSLASLHRRVQ